MPKHSGPVETMTSLQMAEVVEKRHDNVKRTIDSLLERGVIQLPQSEEVTNHLGQTVKIYRVRERDSFVIVAQLSPEFTARLVDFWQKHRSAATIQLPNFADPVAAARAWADACEAKQIADQRALIAEQTKAEIGSRREATAMNTASQAVKRAKRLELELDRALSYASVKRMQEHYRGQKFEWRVLKRASKELGQPPIPVPDQNYGEVKAYHADAWREAYGLDIPRFDGERVQ